MDGDGVILRDTTTQLGETRQQHEEKYQPTPSHENQPRMHGGLVPHTLSEEVEEGTNDEDSDGVSDEKDTDADNDGASDETDTDDEVWYAVNPAVRRTIKFQEALKKLATPEQNNRAD